MKMPFKEIADRAVELSFAWLLSALGGIAHYLYKVSQGMPFMMTMLLINIVLAWFVGTLVGSIIEPGIQYRDAVIAISGFSSLQILGFLENGGWKLIANGFLRSLKIPEIK